jgi:acyl-CoA reductase-like NAD-dependent aldehyde dehydrogenase
MDDLLSRLSGPRAFGGYKESGFGRETHEMTLDHYQDTKNLLVSYSEGSRIVLKRSRGA